MTILLIAELILGCNALRIKNKVNLWWGTTKLW